LTIHYRIITVYTNEEARWKGRPLHDAVVNLVRRRKIAARCHVTRGIAGCYENGEVATHSIVDLSANLPLEIRIVLPTAEAETLLSDLEPMVGEGMILVEDAHVRSHRTAKRLFPRGMRVRDAMTASRAEGCRFARGCWRNSKSRSWTPNSLRSRL
jgi:PII-like signaling protein